MGKVVLVHGAWHGAWCWDAVVDALEARGVDVVAVELPLTDHIADAVAARAAIEAAGEGVVVCGHSYGGMVISEAARDLPGVARLVYLAAFQTESGEDPMWLMETDPSPLLSAIVVTDTLTVDPDRLHEVLYADSDPSVVAEIGPKLRPMPVGDTWCCDEPAWKSTPSTYILCTSDKAISPSVQRTMAARADVVVEWETDHSPFLTRPEELADLLATYT
jgi:pimeloyl-ACP methyl ester carboxylesterase